MRNRHADRSLAKPLRGRLRGRTTGRTLRSVLHIDDLCIVVGFQRRAYATGRYFPGACLHLKIVLQRLLCLPVIILPPIWHHLLTARIYFLSVFGCITASCCHGGISVDSVSQCRAHSFRLPV